MNELWASVPGYPNYEISSSGVVRNATTGLVLKGFEYRGYRFAQIYRDNVRQNFAVSRLVLLSFRGEPPEGHVAAHLNGDRKDNRLLNLAWVTPEENEQHRFLHGTIAKGEKHGAAKFEEEDILWIRAAAKRGVSWAKIAKRYQAGKRTISHIVHRRTWYHIPEPTE